MFNGEQVNDHIKQDDHADDVIEDDGKNTLIHDSLNVRMDNEDDYDNENDIPLLDKVHNRIWAQNPTTYDVSYGCVGQ